MRRPIPALLALLLAAPLAAQTFTIHRVPAPGPRGYGDVHLSKAAEPGQQIRVWWAMMLNPDCSPAGTMDTRLVEPPRHGEARISDEPFFPPYVEPNPRAVCDAHRAPGKQAFYTPAADFHGHDRLVLQNATSEGRMRRIVVDLDVR
jgi:hypothetical protein